MLQSNNFIKMKIYKKTLVLVFFSFFNINLSIAATDICEGFGPQAPRDITKNHGKNKVSFKLAPSYKKMNLCNIHTHTNAEHKGPDFSLFVGKDNHGGYACNKTSLTPAQLKNPSKGSFKGVKAGDTIEVHWVYSSCDVKPGIGLQSCLSPECKNPLLRVEAQIFLLANDSSVLDFANYLESKTLKNSLSQAKNIPSNTGKPIVYRGSTTGSKYNAQECSPLQVTWSVRPNCTILNIESLHNWAKKRQCLWRK